jgi:hypothetical protein
MITSKREFILQTNLWKDNTRKYNRKGAYSGCHDVVPDVTRSGSTSWTYGYFTQMKPTTKILTIPNHAKIPRGLKTLVKEERFRKSSKKGQK